MPKNKKGFVCLGSDRGKKAAQQLAGMGQFNTADLNDIGQAFYDTFGEGDFTADTLVDELEAEWPEGTDQETKDKKLDLDRLFWQHETGAVLVAELAAQGFKVVKERR